MTSLLKVDEVVQEIKAVGPDDHQKMTDAEKVDKLKRNYPLT